MNSKFMDIESLSELPFFSLTNCQSNELFYDRISVWNNVFMHDELRNYIKNLLKDEEFKNLNFQYSTEDDFNTMTHRLKNGVAISALHLNIRSLNGNHRSLCQFLAMVKLKFEIIILSQIWSTSIEFYKNILSGYSFVYETPTTGIAGGIGMLLKAVLYSMSCQNLNCTVVMLKTYGVRLLKIGQSISVHLQTL